MQALLLWLFQWEYNSNVTLKCTDLEGELALHVKSKKYIYIAEQVDVQYMRKWE